MTNNHFSNGHFYYSKEYETMLNNLNLKQIFLYRDPRDIVVSYAYFFMKLENTPTYHFFVKNNMDFKQRCLALINGIDSLNRVNIDLWYRLFIDWKNKNNIPPITFETLIESSQSQKKC
jgi:sulfotransferase 6B1